MKKLFYFFVLVFILKSISSNGQSTIDSIVVRNCYHNDDEGQYYTQTVDSFSVGLHISRYYIDTTNANFLLDTYSYSSTNNILVHQQGALVNSVFTLLYEELYSYDSNDSIINYTRLQSGSGNYRYLYTRDLSGMILKMEFDYYLSNGWTALRIDWYYYTINDSIDYFLSSLPGQTPDSMYLDFLYDSIQNTLTIQEYYWNPSSAAFDDTSDRAIYYYDSYIRPIGRSDSYYYGSQWWDLYDSTYWIYDAQGRTDYIHSIYVPHAGDWTDYIYDSVTNLIDSVNFCHWATHSGRCQYCKYSYFNLPLDVPNIDKNHFIVYPNPVSEKLNFVFVDNQSETFHVNIRNVLSQIVYENDVHSMNGQAEIQISFLSPGIYFVTVDMNDNGVTKKIIVER